MGKKTIYDIAKGAGVSIATVSRVINNSDGIADHTRRKVLDVAESMGYRPQAYAQGLARRKKNLVMVIVPIVSNYFFMEILAGIQDKLVGSRYDLSIYNVIGGDQSGMMKQVDRLISRGLADGYLLVSTHLLNRDLGALKRHEVPITLVDEYNTKFESASVDNQAGTCKAMEYLIGKGYTRIAIISASTGTKPAKERMKGYRRSLGNAGIPVDEQLVVVGNTDYRDGFSEQNGYMAMKQLFDRNHSPDACFCTSDIQALGALKAMKERERYIPIIGYDDITISNYIGLSTVRQPMYEMGEYAIQQLMTLMEKDTHRPTQKIFEPELILRATTEEY